MKIQYFNVFLCRNGEKTNYDLSKLIDIIRVSSPIERTVKLGSQHNLISAKVEFLNPETHEPSEIDLKKDGFYIQEKTSSKTDDFEKLANLMTSHYYDDQNRIKDVHYLSFGSLLSVDESEFDIVTENSI